jgi:uncharacterized protein involved in exopolysaccharide biosynthesis
MPDLFLVFSRRWKFILITVLVVTLVAAIFALLSPKKYLAVATALPVNSLTADKGRLFNQNIQELYSDFGTPDELDRLEGTASLDTIFIAAANEFNLASHYSMGLSGEGPFKAARKLKKNSKIDRSGYGELKVKVWDTDRNLSAALANFLMQQLQQIHQHLQNQSNESVLAKIKDEYALKQKEYLECADSLNNGKDTATIRFTSAKKEIIKTKMTALAEQLQQYEKMIGQYQLALSTNAPVLLVVEQARAPLWADKPKVGVTILFSFFAALLVSFLLALLLESRNTLA